MGSAAITPNHNFGVIYCIVIYPFHLLDYFFEIAQGCYSVVIFAFTDNNNRVFLKAISIINQRLGLTTCGEDTKDAVSKVSTLDFILVQIFVRLGILNMNKNLAVVKRFFDSIVLPILYFFGVDMFLQDGGRL